MASRAVVFGLGLGFGGWIGLALVGIAVGLTVIERFCKGD
jgi:hypothetical protein